MSNDLTATTLQHENFCQHERDETATRKQIGSWFDLYVCNTIDWSTSTDDHPSVVACDMAEDFLLSELMKIHDLPLTDDNEFSINALCRIVAPKDQHELWIEAYEMFCGIQKKATV